MPWLNIYHFMSYHWGTYTVLGEGGLTFVAEATVLEVAYVVGAVILVG